MGHKVRTRQGVNLSTDFYLADANIQVHWAEMIRTLLGYNEKYLSL